MRIFQNLLSVLLLSDKTRSRDAFASKKRFIAVSPRFKNINHIELWTSSWASSTSPAQPVMEFVPAPPGEVGGGGGGADQQPGGRGQRQGALRDEQLR